MLTVDDLAQAALDVEAVVQERGGDHALLDQLVARGFDEAQLLDVIEAARALIGEAPDVVVAGLWGICVGLALAARDDDEAG